MDVTHVFGELVRHSTIEISLLISSAILLILYLRHMKKVQQNLPPGPTGVPFLGYSPFLGADPPKTLLQLSKKYNSNIIGLKLGSKYTVVLNDYETAKEVMCHPSVQYRGTDVFDHFGELGFVTRNGEAWQEQRRNSMQISRDLGLGQGSWENLVQEEIQNFIDFLTSCKGAPVDVYRTMHRTTTISILSLLIGRNLPKDDRRVEMFMDYVKCMSYSSPSETLNMLPFLRIFFKNFKTGSYNKVLKTIDNHRKLITEEISNHKKKSGIYNNIVDFISLYLEKMDETASKSAKHYYSDSMLEGNVSSLLLGGSDTVFSSVGWLFCLMASRPDVQKKVQDELDEVLGEQGFPSYYERTKIPYTFAVMMEAQRYSTIVPLNTPRVTSEDIKVRGFFIPKGTDIVMNQVAIHNDPRYWKEPEKFNPERFLTSDSQLIKNPPSFVPFSLGRRNCPGETVAWMEILAFFTSVLRKFTIKPCPGREVKFEVVHGLVEHLESQEFCFVQR